MRSATDSAIKRHFSYNQRKLRTLEIFLAAEPGFVRPEVYAWKIRKLPARAAYSYLKRLWAWGLLWRQERPVRYRISQRGRERLAWLRRCGDVTQTRSALSGGRT